MRKISGKTILINPQSQSTRYFNSLENVAVNQLDVSKLLDSAIIPLINSVAQTYSESLLSENEKNKIKEIIQDSLESNTTLSVLTLRDELIKHRSETLDLSKVISLLNKLL